MTNTHRPGGTYTQIYTLISMHFMSICRYKAEARGPHLPHAAIVVDDVSKHSITGIMKETVSKLEQDLESVCSKVVNEIVEKEFLPAA